MYACQTFDCCRCLVNMKLKLLVCLWGIVGQSLLLAQELQLSFAEAEARLLATSKAMKIADAEVRAGQYEQRKASAWWWPQLQANGAYAHLSEEIEVRQSLSDFTDPAKAYIQRVLPSETLVSGLLDEVGKYTFSFPLLPQDITSVGVSAEWVAFSGGKRIYANRISRQLTAVAEINSQQVGAAERVLLVEHYYGLVLAMQSEAVCKKRYEGLQRHYRDALRLEGVGMVDKAARLLVQVSVDEASREWKQAKSAVHTAQAALKQLLEMTEEELQILPTTPLFVAEQLPAEEMFAESMRRRNHTLNTLHVEEQIARDKLRVDQSAYLPEVALFGKQTLYAHGLPSNLFPRTMIGVGFTWSLFSGLERVSQIAQTRLAQQSLAWSREEVEGELAVVVAELYATLQRAYDEIGVIDSSIALHEELLRMRRIAFAEGMVTTAEVIDAENALADVLLARLAAYYTYDVALANLLAVCGMTDDWSNYN